MKKAVFTIVKNEMFFVNKWFEYYSKYFDSNDIYILDHESIDGSLDLLQDKCNIIRVENPIHFNHTWLNETVKNFQKKLLESYDVVVFAEADEFIIPINCKLSEYIENFKDDYVTCQGIELLHSGKDYEPHKLILEQKDKFVVSNKFGTKTLISRIPLNWTLGFHWLNDKPNKIDENLLCVHLHWFDYNVFIQRAKQRLEFKHLNEKGNLGIQNKHTELTAYENEFWNFQKHTDYSDIIIPKVI